MPVAFVITATDESEVGLSVDHTTSRLDDAMWTIEIARPFTWQRYLNWWVARRWIIPRDVRRT